MVSVALRPFSMALDAYFVRVARRRGFLVSDNALTAASSAFLSTTSGSNRSGRRRGFPSCSTQPVVVLRKTSAMPGYAEYLAAISDPAHPEHEHMRLWVSLIADAVDDAAVALKQPQAMNGAATRCIGIDHRRRSGRAQGLSSRDSAQK